MKKILRKILLSKEPQRCDSCVFWHDLKEKNTGNGFCSVFKSVKVSYSGFNCGDFKVFSVKSKKK